jgi:hypothetical protein
MIDIRNYISPLPRINKLMRPFDLYSHNDLTTIEACVIAAHLKE